MVHFQQVSILCLFQEPCGPNSTIIVSIPEYPYMQGVVDIGRFLSFSFSCGSLLLFKVVLLQKQ